MVVVLSVASRSCLQHILLSQHFRASPLAANQINGVHNKEGGGGVSKLTIFQQNYAFSDNVSTFS